MIKSKLKINASLSLILILIIAFQIMMSRDGISKNKQQEHRSDTTLKIFDALI